MYRCINCIDSIDVHTSIDVQKCIDMCIEFSSPVYHIFIYSYIPIYLIDRFSCTSSYTYLKKYKRTTLPPTTAIYLSVQLGNRFFSLILETVPSSQRTSHIFDPSSSMAELKTKPASHEF